MTLVVPIRIAHRPATPRSISIPTLSSQSSMSRANFSSPSQSSLASQNFSHYNSLNVSADATEDITIKLPPVQSETNGPLVSSDSTGLYSR